MDYSSPDDTVHTLFFDVDARTVDFGPVFGLAADLFTHIGLAFMNPIADRQLNLLSPFPLLSSQTLSLSTPGEDIGSSGQSDDVLKFLALKRDGTSCPFSEIPYYGLGGVDPVLSHVIPSSIRYKPETLDFISVIAGAAAMDSILQYSNTIDNVLATEANIATSHRLSHWGLEASESPEDVNLSTYHFKTFHAENEYRVGSIFLRDGDEIVFGLGPEGTHLRNGPHPLLCNLRLAVGRALCNSGAADFITRLMEDANDMDCPHHVAWDEDFHEVLNAKLLICGRAQMVELPTVA
ncbi:hypothetical protein H0H92_007248 [Tricholoma furcatifolium]|nr:hypothetical protein H0H92_007248 [Tricholoma furcatifolium]